jgi:hypothetical protein
LAVLVLASTPASAADQQQPQQEQYPQGYYAFEESPAKIPPKVRKPPYLQTQVHCPGKSRSQVNGCQVVYSAYVQQAFSLWAWND